MASCMAPQVVIACKGRMCAALSGMRTSNVSGTCESHCRSRAVLRDVQMGNGTCLFVGDDEAFIAEAADLAQRELGCKVFADRAKYELPRHKQSMFNHLPLEERCKATLHLLKDLELLAHSDYFVGAPAPRARRLMARRRAASGRETTS